VALVTSPSLAAPPAPVPSTQVDPAELLAEEPAAPVSAPARTPAHVTHAVAARAGRTAPAAGNAATLSQELAVLDAARSTLADGRAQGALSLLDAYERAFPRGRLELEAELLRIDALARSGRSDAAHRQAQAFLRHHPSSVLGPRVRSYLDD
jgi:hypothetical protein